MNFPCPAPCKALRMEPARGHGNNANVTGGGSQLGAPRCHQRPSQCLGRGPGAVGSPLPARCLREASGSGVTPRQQSQVTRLSLVIKNRRL